MWVHQIQEDEDVGTVIGVRETWLELKPLLRVPMTARAIMVPTRTSPKTPKTRLTRRHQRAFCHLVSSSDISEGFALAGGGSSPRELVAERAGSVLGR